MLPKLMNSIQKTKIAKLRESSIKREPPQYYSEVENNARMRWEQLEQDPDLAGPWHQLFAQVQNPRHILSELLQNADDAEAEQASAWIDGDVFIFEHDGHDFDEEQFTSLCRFGFSNKRRLHTIGFRGVGFKSTFSLGKVVEVITPTLAVNFEAHRFTQPKWLSDAPSTSLTRISVRIEDSSRKEELQKNLSEWAKSPASLLFFRNIRKLNIENRVVEKNVIGNGPVPESEEVQLIGKETLNVLVFHSSEEEFPEDAIEEICQERIAKDVDLPPCRVEIVLGLKENQGLYVILPTDIKFALPYTCNAPFVQDPARTGIKDPAISPTNRWLLNRLGQLAAEKMVFWLGNKDLSMNKRVQAYDFLPSSIEWDSSTSGESGRLIFESFISEIPEDNLLTYSGCLQAKDMCIAPPHELYDVWTYEQILNIFGRPEQVVITSELLADHREKLVALEWLNTISHQEVLSMLDSEKRIPKPNTLQSLKALWFLVRQWVSGDWGDSLKKRLLIVPVEGDDNLFSSSEIIRLSANTSRLSEEDWQFITNGLPILDRNWIEYLTLSKEMDSFQDPEKESSRQLLQIFELHETTRISILIEKAYKNLIRQENISIQDRVRMTHIVANLGIESPQGFEFVTRDGVARSVASELSADFNGTLEDILSGDFAQQHLIHESYSSTFRSCSRQQWMDWVHSSKSGLQTFVGICFEKNHFFGRGKLEKFVQERRGIMPTTFQLKSQYFEIEDYDFDIELLNHWEGLTDNDSDVWCRLVQLISEDTFADWSKKKDLRIFQPGNTYRYPVDCGDVSSKWISRLSELPCLKDTHGFVHTPAELLLRTSETEGLIDIELFVCSEMDIPANREFLKILGVRDTPTSLDKLIDRLRVLSKVKNPPLLEVAKWYSRLDQIIPRCSTEELENAKSIFSSEQLIITAENEWCSSNEIYQYSEEHDIPGAPILHPEIRSFSLWSRLGVAERPTAELTIAYLQQIESNCKLNALELKRVKFALQKYPVRVWNECGHWINLDSTWVPISDLEFKLSMQQLTRFGELFPVVRSKTADLRVLSFDLCDRDPFNTLKNLGDVIENRIMEKRGGQSAFIVKDWMASLGNGLKRIKLLDEEKTICIRQIATRLEKTKWQIVQSLKVVPYISGTPGGQEFSPDVHWDDDTLYVKDVPLVKIFKTLVEAIAEPFGISQITDAVRSCVDRDEEFVKEYIACNFELEDIPIENQFENMSNELVDSGSSSHEKQPGIDNTGIKDVDLSSLVSNSEAGESIMDGENKTTLKEEEMKDDINKNFPGEENSETDDQHQRSSKSQKISLVARYARSQGLQWIIESNRYVHQNGSWLQKGEGSFNWERCDRLGNIVCRYWVAEQCLQTNGIEIHTDLWEMIKKYPESSALILVDPNDVPIEIRGEELLKKIECNEMVLFPAKYRLRLVDA